MVDARGPGALENAMGSLWLILCFQRLYAFQLSEGVYKRKEVTREGVGSLEFGELSDLDT